jgi:endogenous inhibitor of DNA gyrase (YacG/DUF329 family)
MKCEYCGREFAAQRSTARFCSSKCRVYALRRGTSLQGVGNATVTGDDDDESEQEFPLVLAACQGADRVEQELFETLKGEMGPERLERRSVTGSSALDGHAAPRTGGAYVYVTNLGDNNVSVTTRRPTRWWGNRSR